MGEQGSTQDAFFGERLLVDQPRRGHRSGTDAVLLAASAPTVGGAIVDVGAGVGVVGLGAALWSPQAEVVLVEFDAPAAALARANLARAGRRGRVVEADVLDPAARRSAGLANGAAALVLTNPPFYPSGRVRAPADPSRAAAHVLPADAADESVLTRWVRAALALLAPDGEFRLIHRADALAGVLEAVGGRLGALRILPIHPREGAPASRILLAGKKGSRAPLTIEPALALHDERGDFTPLARRLAAGEARLLASDGASGIAATNV